MSIAERQCAYKNCSNSLKNNKNVRFFKFPLSATRREKWSESCEMVDLLSSSSLVCSDHFEPHHFVHQNSKCGPLAWDAQPTIPARKNNESREVIYPMQTDWGSFLCRLCAKPVSVKSVVSSPPISDLETSHQIGLHIFGAEGRALELAEKINMCVAKPVELDDSLPKFACRVCIEHLRRAADILSNFRQADHKIRTQLVSKKNLTDLEDCSLQGAFSLSSTEDFKCPYCDQVFTSLQDYLHHELVHSGNLLLDTPTTSRTPSVDTPNTILPVSCCECPNTNFLSQKSLEIHLNQIHNKKSTSSMLDNLEVNAPIFKFTNQLGNRKCNLDKFGLKNIRKLTPGKSILKINDSNESINEMNESFDDTEPTTYINLVKSENDDNNDIEFVNVNEEISYICSFCDSIFHDAKLFKRHIKSHKTKIKCTHCNKLYTEKGLKIHQDRLKGFNNHEYICDLCQKVFLTRHYLVMHIKNTHNNKKLPCTKCPRSFKSKEGLMGHLMHHEGIYSFLCDICGKSFLTQSTMRIHRRKHTEQNFFTCHHCGKKIQERNRFEDHLRTHTGETPFGCQLCSRKFHSKKLLKQHMQIHNDNRPYKCSQCNLSFKRVGNLKQHIERHSNYRPICSICRLSFDTCLERNEHRRTHTQDEREKIKLERLKSPKGPKRNRNQFLCKGCNTVFSSKDEKNQHISDFPDHIKVIKCDSCDKTFRSQQSLTIHQSVHTGERPYACSFCLKTFRTYSTCRQHTQIHSSHGQFKCEQCDRSFHRQYTLNVHLRSHTNERPFECTICGRGFKQNQDMKKHMKLHAPKEVEVVPKWGQFMIENQILEQTITIPTSIQQDLQLATSNIVITVPFVSSADTQNFFEVD